MSVAVASSSCHWLTFVALIHGIERPREAGLGVVSCSEVGAPSWTRTHDLQVRNLTLYPLSYGRAMVAEREGFEPSRQVTPPGGLANRCTRPLCDLSLSVEHDTLAHLVPSDAIWLASRVASNRRPGLVSLDHLLDGG